MPIFDLTGISHLTQDSRNVVPGSLFVALQGMKNDGVKFIPQAEQNGAVAVLCSDDAILPPTQMRVIRSPNPRLALAQISAQFYPKQPAYIAAVTGTDGKTSTADFFRQLTHLAGYASAAIGTLGIYAGDGRKIYDATHTTPDAMSLHAMLQNLAEIGFTHVCMEASSHGLDQYRLHGVQLTAAAFTNIARDHLDYHNTEQQYFEAKARLFTEILPEGKTAVVNADDTRADELRALCKARTQVWCDFGYHAEQLKVLALSPTPHGQDMHCRINGREYRIHIPLAGAFQTMNILAALGLAQATGIPIEKMIPLIPKLQGVPGRLQLSATTQHGAAIYVDYAHTPAALENILRTLRPHTQNSLHVIFGCGGNRDSGKRSEMGKIADHLADVVIVTDDNPRDENPAEIRASIIAACPRAIEIADRTKAITTAIATLKAGDVLVIAGKGHEKTQIIRGTEHHHDDVEIAQAAV